MNRAIFATLVLLLGSLSSAWGYRVLEQAEDAYELMLGEVSLPRSAAGSVIFKPCPDCNTTSLRVSGETTYLLNGSSLELSDFLEAAEAIRQQDGGNRNTAVYVFFDVDSKRVNRLELEHFTPREWQPPGR